jgi:hypothetical protein
LINKKYTTFSGGTYISDLEYVYNSNNTISVLSNGILKTTYTLSTNQSYIVSKDGGNLLYSLTSSPFKNVIGIKEAFLDLGYYVNPENNMVIVRQGKNETFRWTLLFGRLVAAYMNQGNDLTDPSKNFEEQFEGIYESDNGEKYEIVYKGTNPKTRENWSPAVPGVSPANPLLLTSKFSSNIKLVPAQILVRVGV